MSLYSLVSLMSNAMYFVLSAMCKFLFSSIVMPLSLTIALKPVISLSTYIFIFTTPFCHISGTQYIFHCLYYMLVFVFCQSFFKIKGELIQLPKIHPYNDTLTIQLLYLHCRVYACGIFRLCSSLMLR